MFFSLKPSWVELRGVTQEVCLTIELSELLLSEMVLFTVFGGFAGIYSLCARICK